MVNRTVKIMGNAYSTSGNNVTITVTYNGQQVFSGAVATTRVSVLPVARPDQQLAELGTFQTTTDVVGNIPVRISVSGGRLFFGHFWMNYIGTSYAKDPVPTNPDVPINLNDPSTYRWVLLANTASHFGDPNTNTVASDGLSNTRINGKAFNWRVNVNPNQLGDWVYPISSNETFEFTFFVDPNKIQLTDTE